MKESGYQARINGLNKRLLSKGIRERSRQGASQTFSRNRKMPVGELLVCTLSKKGMTTDMELRKYAGERDNKTKPISKQGYLQQRKRLNPEVFRYLNQTYLQEFYDSKEDIKKWKGHLLLAVDGSKAEVPNSRENRQEFGQCGNQYTAEGPVRAQISSIYDTLNGFFLDVQIGAISASESEQAKAGLAQLQPVIGEHPVVLLFDRGYPSIEFVDYLETSGYSYLFRLSSNDYKKERRTMESNDEVVELEHTGPRMQKVRLQHPERLEELRSKSGTKVRIVRYQPSSQGELALMTNLPQTQYSYEELGQLYWKRWGIEQAYHTLKNKLKLESVTGKAAIYVYQDFLAQILVCNMVQDIRHSADVQVYRRGVKTGCRYPMHTNENLAIGLFKERMIRILLEKSDHCRSTNLKSLQLEMERYTLPRRSLPGYPRKKRLTNKYSCNQKFSF